VTPPADPPGPVAPVSSTSARAQLADVYDELDRLLALVTGPCAERTDAASLPAEDAAARGHVLGLLGSIHAQHPGAWMPVHTIASYQTDRQNYGRVRRAAAALVTASQVQHMRVHINQTRKTLIRTPTDVDALDPDQIRDQANTALEPLGYQVTISPARKIIDNFTAVTVTHANREYIAYRWTRPYIVKVAGHPAA
jgi:hypothetical protein